LPVLGSTDAQSIAGLVCTDLHGTGRDHGFLSEQILSLRIIDARGVARTVKRGDPLFHAAIGGLGALGVIAEVELALVPAFNLRKTVRMVDRGWAEEHIDELLSRRDHLSFYYAGGAAATRSVRMHTWDCTDESPDQDWQKTMADAELGDFVLSGFVPGAIELLGTQNADALWIQPFVAEKSFVAPAGRAFGRRLFYRHDEIEYGLPYENYRTVLDEVMKLLSERNYFSIVEVRFTPNTSQALIGPGVGRRTAYIELATPLSQATGDIYAEVEDIFRKHGGQPHLGKKTKMTSAEMLTIYGKRFADFAALRAKQDPQGKFKNRFIEQVF
jgi:FAD/FMN-containing dehydrogenase